MTIFIMLLSVWLQGNELPIQNTKVTQVAIGNLLEWEGASLEGQVFVIQRSSDGLFFRDIGTVEAEGLRKKPYFFLDRTPKQERFYYRITARSNRENSHYTGKICIANRSEDLDFRIASVKETRIDNAIDIEYYTTFSGTLTLQLQDDYGKLLKESSVQANKGKNRLVFKLEQVPIGLYALVLRYNDKQDTIWVEKVLPASFEKLQVAAGN